MGNIDLSRIIQNLSFRYTRYINWKRKPIGHLFQGRFKSILVDSGRYLKELIRYIHLNPVRAGLVIRPEHYRWSSHNAYLGVSDLVWLAPNNLLSRFGNSFQTAVSNYERFIHYANNNPDEIDFKRGTYEGILGDEGFVKMVNEKAESLYEINFGVLDLVKIVCEFYNVDIDSLKRPGKERCLSHVRAVLALIVQDNIRLTLEELSQIVQLDASSLSKHAARLKFKSLTSEELMREIEKIKTYILQMPECQA